VGGHVEEETAGPVGVADTTLETDDMLRNPGQDVIKRYLALVV
jgi:hypothetical protein